MQLDNDHVAWFPTSLYLCARPCPSFHGAPAAAAAAVADARWPDVSADSYCEISCSDESCAAEEDVDLDVDVDGAEDDEMAAESMEGAAAGAESMVEKIN